MKVFHHLGNAEPDYRTIMKEHKGVSLGKRQIPADRLVIAEQTHSDIVHVCAESDSGAGFGSHPQIAGADALISNIPGQYLLVRTADCFPVLLLDRRNRAVGAVHSGREGTRKNITGKEEFGVEARDIIAWIGPGICARHYEVGGDIWEEYIHSMLSNGFEPDLFNERQIDLRGGIFQQLAAAGVPAENIKQRFICTWESAEHFSFRRDGTHNRQINLAGIEYE